MICQVYGLDFLKSHLYIRGLTTIIRFCVEPTLSIPRWEWGILHICPEVCLAARREVWDLRVVQHSPALPPRALPPTSSHHHLLLLHLLLLLLLHPGDHLHHLAEEPGGLLHLQVVVVRSLQQCGDLRVICVLCSVWSDSLASQHYNSWQSPGQTKQQIYRTTNTLTTIIRSASSRPPPASPSPLLPPVLPQLTWDGCGSLSVRLARARYEVSSNNLQIFPRKRFQNSLKKVYFCGVKIFQKFSKFCPHPCYRM